MTQLPIFGYHRPPVKELEPLYLSEFNDRIYQSKDYQYIADFAAFWAIPGPTEFAPVYFHTEGVELRRIRQRTI